MHHRGCRVQQSQTAAPSPHSCIRAGSGARVVGGTGQQRCQPRRGTHHISSPSSFCAQARRRAARCSQRPTLASRTTARQRHCAPLSPGRAWFADPTAAASPFRALPRKSSPCPRRHARRTSAARDDGPHASTAPRTLAPQRPQHCSAAQHQVAWRVAARRRTPRSAQSSAQRDASRCALGVHLSTDDVPSTGSASARLVRLYRARRRAELCFRPTSDDGACVLAAYRSLTCRVGPRGDAGPRGGNSHPSGSPERHGDLPAGRLPRAGAAGAGRVRRRHTPAAAAARAAERHSAQRGAGARGRRLLVWAHPRCVHAPTRLVGPRKSPWGYAQGNAPPVSALRPPSLPCLGPSARRAAAQSTAALGVAA